MSLEAFKSFYVQKIIRELYVPQIPPRSSVKIQKQSRYDLPRTDARSIHVYNMYVVQIIIIMCIIVIILTFALLTLCCDWLTEQSIKMFIRGRPITMYIPSNIQNYEDLKMEPPSEKLELDWVYPLHVSDRTELD